MTEPRSQDGPEYDGTRANGQTDLHVNADTHLNSILWVDSRGPYCTVAIGTDNPWKLYMTPESLERLRAFLGDVSTALADMTAPVSA